MKALLFAGYQEGLSNTDAVFIPSVIQLLCPVTGEDTLEPITWQEFFGAFEKNNLAFLYQEETKDGGISRFSKLIDRDSATQSKAAHS